MKKEQAFDGWLTEFSDMLEGFGGVLEEISTGEGDNSFHAEYILFLHEEFLKLCAKVYADAEAPALKA